MLPDCGGRSDDQTDGQIESIIAKTALCIASYADALSKRDKVPQKSQKSVSAYC